MNESILNFPYTWHFSSSMEPVTSKKSSTQCCLWLQFHWIQCFCLAFPYPKNLERPKQLVFFWMPVVYFRLFLGKNSCEIITCCHQNCQLHGVLRWTCAWWEPTMLQERSQILRLRLMSPAVLLRMVSTHYFLKGLGLGSWGNCCDICEFVGGFFCDFYNLGPHFRLFKRKMIHHSTCMKWVYLILHWYCYYCFCWVCAMYETHFNLWLVGSSNIRGDMWWHGDALRFTPITDAGTLKIEASSQDSCLDEAVLWCSAKKNKQLPIRHLEATSWLLRIFSCFFFGLVVFF